MPSLWIGTATAALGIILPVFVRWVGVAISTFAVASLIWSLSLGAKPMYTGVLCLAIGYRMAMQTWIVPFSLNYMTRVGRFFPKLS